MNNIKFDFDDITIVPAILSDIASRKEINLEYLPLVVAPMDTVIDKNNVKIFKDLGYEVCMPRGEDAGELNDQVFHSYGLDEIVSLVESNNSLPKKVLIDVASAHMRRLFDISKTIKEKYPNVYLMIGNIANPETFRLYSEIGVDACRIGVGRGSSCTTSANTGIHYPYGSLIKECYEIACTMDKPAEIIADGGFKNFDDVIKAIALGADRIMIGGILNKTIEACADNYEVNHLVQEYNKLSDIEALHRFNEGKEVYKKYRGMSTKEVQAKWGKTTLKTAEGISKYNKVEYTVAGWTENFVDYLKSNMSYCGKRNLNEYKGEVQYVFITENARKSFRK